MRKAKGDMKKIEMEKEEEENEGGGAETTMETEVHAAVAAEMGKVNATIEKQMKDGMDRMLKIFNQAIVKIQEDIQEVKNGEKEAKATMRATARARAAAKARKRAKAKQRKQVKLDGDLDGSTEAEAISGGDAITVDERMQSGDEDDSSVPVIGRDAATLIQGVELSLGGASDGTFREANVGGDNDETYEEDDFSIAEASPAMCESDPMFGMSFANVNIERIFLYFHYEFVKRDFG